MCTWVYSKKHKERITSVRGLIDFLAVDPVNLVWSDGPGYATDPWKKNFEYCLCPIDVEASFRNCGHEGEWGAGDRDPACFVVA